MKVFNERPIDKRNRIYSATIVLGPHEYYTHNVFPKFSFPPQVYITCIDPKLEPNLYWESTLYCLGFINRGDEELSFNVTAKPATIRSDIKITKDNWRQFYFSERE